MSKSTQEDEIVKIQKEFFEYVILPLADGMLKKHGSIENAIKSSPFLLLNAPRAIARIDPNGPHMHWVVNEYPFLSLEEMQESLQNFKNVAKNIEKEKTSPYHTPTEDDNLIGNDGLLENEDY